MRRRRPVALPRLLPLGGLHDVRRGEVVERHVLARARAAAEAPRAEHAGHRGERGDVLLVVPLVELGLPLGGDVHGVQEEPARVRRRELIAGQDLHALGAQQQVDLAGHALGPDGEVRPADGLVRGAVQHLHRVQVVGGQRDLAALHADPAPAEAEAGHALALGDVLEVVPVVELVLGGVREVHRGDQRALGHGDPPLGDLDSIIECPPRTTTSLDPGPLPRAVLPLPVARRPPHLAGVRDGDHRPLLVRDGGDGLGAPPHRVRLAALPRHARRAHVRRPERSRWARATSWRRCAGSTPGSPRSSCCWPSPAG